MTNRELKQMQEREYVLRMRNHQLQDMIGENEAEIKRIQKSLSEKQEWYFNFVGGGYNSVWAITIEQAKEKAEAEYPGRDIDPKSFRVPSTEEKKNLSSLFD
jgi:hypothetical protein